MPDALERAIIRKLQDDLPLIKEPYMQIAEELGITEELLINKIKILKEKKMLRRMGGILYHQQAGFKANALVVWQAAEEEIQQTAKRMAAYKEVSHCYEREKLEDWPYNIYTMIHAQSFETCEAVILDIAKETNIKKYEVLYSIKELKKAFHCV